jgi:hypothetical protein
VPIYVVLLALWVGAIIVSFVVFDGPTAVYQWISIVLVFVMLVVLIAGELRLRAGR